tara:strand:- start:2467 stop:3147 length:681 start_codon:yes stop_codon:yes gene_type:complete
MTTYSGLVDQIRNYTETDSNVLTTTIVNDFITQAELRIFREIDLDVFRSYEFATLTASNPFVALPGSTPSTMSFVRYASIYQTTGATANERTRLLQKDVSYMNEYWPNRGNTGQPKYYAMWDQNTIYLAPTPNLAYNIELALNRNETGLSSTNTTTWVSQNAPQVLLYACLIEAFKYLKGPYDLLAQYDKSYQQALERLQIEQQGRRRRDEYQDGVIRVPLQSQNP